MIIWYCTKKPFRVGERSIAKNPIFSYPSSLFLVVLFNYFCVFFWFFDPSRWPGGHREPGYRAGARKNIEKNEFSCYVLSIHTILPLYSQQFKTVHGNNFFTILLTYWFRKHFFITIQLPKFQKFILLPVLI